MAPRGQTAFADRFERPVGGVHRFTNGLRREQTDLLLASASACDELRERLAPADLPTTDLLRPFLRRILHEPPVANPFER